MVRRLALLLLGQSLLTPLWVAPAQAGEPGFVARNPYLIISGEGPTVSTCRRKAAVDAWPGGRFVVAWVSGHAYGLVQYFSSEGEPEGVFPLSPVGLVDIVANADGGFWTTYESNPDSNPPPNGPLNGRYYRPSPQSYPQAFQVADFQGRKPVVASDDQNRFYAAWTLDSLSVMAGRYESDGTQIGADIEVASLAGAAESVSLVAAGDGSFVVLWEDFVSPGGSTLYYRRFDSAGEPLGDAVALPAVDPKNLRATGTRDGKVAFLYSDADQKTLTGHVLGADGNLGPAFNIWNDPQSTAANGDLDFIEGDDLAVAVEIHLDGGRGSVHLLRFKADGESNGSRVTVAIAGMPEREFLKPRIAGGDNRLTVVYVVSDSGQECGLRYQVFDATLFADSFESGDLSAWSE